MLGKLNLAIGVSLALPDENLISVQIDVTPAKPGQFADSHSGSVHQSDHQCVTKRRGGLQDATDFVSADHDNLLPNATWRDQAKGDISETEFIPSVTDGDQLHADV